MHPVIDDFVCVRTPIIEARNALSLSLSLSHRKISSHCSLNGPYVLRIGIIVSDSCLSARKRTHDTSCSFVSLVIDRWVCKIAGFDELPHITVFPVDDWIEEVFSCIGVELRAIRTFCRFSPANPQD